MAQKTIHFEILGLAHGGNSSVRPCLQRVRHTPEGVHAPSTCQLRAEKGKIFSLRCERLGINPISLTMNIVLGFLSGLVASVFVS